MGEKKARFDKDNIFDITTDPSGRVLWLIDGATPANNSRYFYLVAIEHGKIVGFSGAELKSGKLAYLMKGYVEPAYRRKKIMHRLEGKLIEILRG